MLALADRLFLGLGVQRSPEVALQYANLAARDIVVEIEQVRVYQVSKETVAGCAEEP
jgi:hypothetical protein